MIKLENVEVMGWEHAIRGMRNPMNSWDKSDSEPGCEIVEGSHEFCRECDHAVRIHGSIVCDYGYTPDYVLGINDFDLMLKLANNGSVHAKYRRMITVYVDITAPLYWWKEFDTYKVGTVANSCSTMHKIGEKRFERDDFSIEHLHNTFGEHWLVCMDNIISSLNVARDYYLNWDELLANDQIPAGATKKDYWWQMIQLLPSSYNQKRTVMLNYEVLAGIYQYRREHKLDEWCEFCKWIEKLPYNDIITGEGDNDGKG